MVKLTTSDFPEYTGSYNLKITTKPDTDFLAGNTPVIYTDDSKMQAGVGAALLYIKEVNSVMITKFP